MKNNSGFRKKILIAAMISFLLIGSSGCVQPQSDPDPDNPIVLTMWHNYGGDMQESMDYLIDEFNTTIGKEKGIVIDVTAISSSSELNKSLSMIVNDDPGAPAIPDIFTGYPKIGIQFQEKGMLANFDDYFTAEELEAYVSSFLSEGRFADGGLYVFPLAKSTEALYLNQTLFDRFAAETGANIQQLSTFEGIAELSQMYYRWTDNLTPDLPGDGKQFFSADSWFNLAQTAMVQLGTDLFDEQQRLSLNNDTYRHIFETLYHPIVKGGFAVYDGYSSDLSKTGDIICSTGSSAGILFYGDTITYPDGTVEPVTYSILPYPVFNDGKPIALQRGGGLMVSKSDGDREKAACTFIKWLTESKQNMKFISTTGYLPVTKQAFEADMDSHIQSLEDARIKMMLTAVLLMYDRYDFYVAPNFSDYDQISSDHEARFKNVMTRHQTLYQNGEAVSPEQALSEIQD